MTDAELRADLVARNGPLSAQETKHARVRLGLFDVLAVGPVDVRLVEVKAGGE